MNILYHHRIRSKDGQFVHVEELTTALKGLGHQLVFVGPGAIETESFGAEAGAVAVLKARMPKFLYELLEFGYAFYDFLRLMLAILRHRPDGIYERYNLFLPSGVWAARLSGLPLLLEVNAPLFAERAKYDGIALERFAAAVERYTWRGADRVLPVTDVLGGIVREAGVPAERIRVIPNGINGERFDDAPDRESAKAALGLTGRVVLGFTGFVREWHGLDRVLEYLASANYPDLHLLLVGDGPARAALQDTAKRLGIEERFTVTGIVGRDRVARHVAAFDIALQPSVVAYASPLKLFEYLALGHAIVAPATSNIKEVLTDGDNAFLFDPDDPSAFHSAVERLCRDAALRRRLGAAARETISKKSLTWAGNARRVVAIFEELGIRSSA